MVSVVVELGAGWLTVLSSLVVVVVDWGCSPEQPANANKGIATRQEGKKYFMKVVPFAPSPVKDRAASGWGH